MNITPIVVGGSESLFAGTVFVAGVLSFFAPCTYPLLPVYIGLLTDTEVLEEGGLSTKNSKWTALLKTLLFILGLSTTFVSLGFGFGALGAVFKSDLFLALSGLVVIFLGLHQMELLKIPNFEKYRTFKWGQNRKNSYLSAYVLGLTFSFGWTPCVGPVLGAVLAVSASSGKAFMGGALMGVYTLGLAIPFILMALMSTVLLNHFYRVEKYLGALKKFGGGLIVLMGILLLTGQMKQVSIWLNRL